LNFATFLLLLAFTACSRVPYSSPTALRDTNFYVRTISPPTPAALDPAALDQITASMDGKTLVVTRPTRPWTSEPDDGFAHSLKRLAPGEKLEGDGATFEMLAFSVSGPGISPVPTNGESRVPADFFDPDGRPLSREQLGQLGFRDMQLKEYVRNSFRYPQSCFPKLKVWFGSQERPPGYVWPIGCFDVRTKHLSVSDLGYSQISSNGPGYAELDTSLWHSTPMDLVMEVGLDGKVVVQTNASAGMTVPVPGGFVRLVGLWNRGDSGERGLSPNRSAAGMETTRIAFRPSKVQTNAMALFATEPRRLVVSCELLDSRGNALGGRGGSSSDGMRQVDLQGRVEDVKWVRYTVYTNHYRVVFRIPPIPKLPPASQNISNLFDVPIPLVQINSEDYLCAMIARPTQMRFRCLGTCPSMPTNLFPLTLTNATPADLLTLYRQSITNAYTVVVDDQKHEIRVELTPLEKAKGWVKQKLKL